MAQDGFGDAADVLVRNRGRMRPWLAMAAVVVMEAGCALCIRDNLTLNVIMLVHPFDAIRDWQLAAQPHP